jgi:hypothetical protein
MTWHRTLMDGTRTVGFVWLERGNNRWYGRGVRMEKVMGWFVDEEAATAAVRGLATASPLR